MISWQFSYQSFIVKYVGLTPQMKKTTVHRMCVRKYLINLHHSFGKDGQILILDSLWYCKTRIIRVALFSRGHQLGYVHETLYSRFDLSCSIIFILEIISEDFALANLRENKVHANKKCFIVNTAISFSKLQTFCFWSTLLYCSWLLIKGYVSERMKTFYNEEINLSVWTV